MEDKEEKEKNLLDSLSVVPIKESVVCTYYEGKEIRKVRVDLNPEDSIGVEFEKGYVIVRTQFETKFVCKGNLFISMWR